MEKWSGDRFSRTWQTQNIAAYVRPIKLLCTISKNFEITLNHRLLAFCDENVYYYYGIIPYHQFGFRRLHSTTHLLQRVTEKIVNGFKGRLYTAGVFLEIASAFDTVSHQILIYKTLCGGVQHTFCKSSHPSSSIGPSRSE